MKAALSKLPNLMNLPLKFPAPLTLVCVCRMHCTIQYYLSIHWSVPIESSIPACMYVYVHIWPKPASIWPYDLLVSLLPHVAWYLCIYSYPCLLSLCYHLKNYKNLYAYGIITFYVQSSDLFNSRLSMGRILCWPASLRCFATHHMLCGHVWCSGAWGFLSCFAVWPHVRSLE